MKSIVKNVLSFHMSAVLVCCCFCIVAAAPYQELQPRPGYVPVYIREGDTPLEDINPKLAEAFHEIKTNNTMLEDNGSVLLITSNQSLNGTRQQLENQQKNGQEKNPDHDDEPEIPADVIEITRPNKESDIASFDVVKTSDVDVIPTEVVVKLATLRSLLK